MAKQRIVDVIIESAAFAIILPFSSAGVPNSVKREIFAKMIEKMIGINYEIFEWPVSCAVTRYFDL